jgi:uncharacterized protein involved in exopolysaccharide biosynthesis
VTIPRQSEALPVPANAPREIILPDDMSREAKDISAVSLINVLLRHRWFIIILALAFGFYAGFKSIRSPKSFTTSSSFMPKGARGQGQLGGLAAQLGINIGGGDAASSPQLYTDLLETRTLLWPVAQKTYRIRRPTGPVEGNLVQIFNIKGGENVQRVRVVNRLRGAVKATVLPKTGVIKMNVTTGNAALSYQISQHMLEQLNVYNLTTRQQAASAEREFAERQMDEKRAELRQAEQALESFLEGNRQYRTSPQLTLEYGRLDRQVAMRNQIYSSMLAAYEQARIEEVRNLPVITIIEAPEQAIGPNPRGGVRKTAIGLLIGLVLGCLIAFVRDRFARTRASGSDEFLEFAALKREAISDITHPWRPFTRAIGSRRRA